MLLSLLAALAQPAAPATVRPVPAVYRVYGDYGRPGRPGNIGRLLDQWTAEGALAARRDDGPPVDITACLARAPERRVDFECVRRLHPQRPGELPRVAIVARDSGRVIPVYEVACIGPSGRGRAEVDMNRGGAFSSDRRQQSEIREALAGCIRAALEGAVVQSAGAMRGFDFWGTGDNDLAYNRLTGDCAQLQHRIGRNAVRGSFGMPLDGVRWSLVTAGGSLPQVRFDCTQGTCVRLSQSGQRRTAALHRVPFADVARAQSFMNMLDSLKRRCGA